MLSFVQSWFAAGANPVGIDFGSECLRLAQVEKTGNDCRLIAAASRLVPSTVRGNAKARAEFFATALRELWTQGNFRGRRAMISLPSASMYVQHMRLPRMDEESIKKALPWETQGKLPIESKNAILRHLVAGDIYCDQEPRSEVILLAAERELVETLLAGATSARLDVVGINVEPLALIDCFLHIYRRKTDADVTNCFVDIGSAASRAVVAKAGHIFFARNLPVGGDDFSRAVASELNIGVDAARKLRIRLASAPSPTPARIEAADLNQTDFAQAGKRPAVRVERRGDLSSAAATMLLDKPDDAPALACTDERSAVERAVQKPLQKLIEELSLCRRYHESTFPDHPIQRLIFVGGEARQHEICRQVARKLALSAQVGDPLVRMGRTTDVGIESGIDRRQPQPGWAVAIGLSLGTFGSTPA